VVTLVRSLAFLTVVTGCSFSSPYASPPEVAEPSDTPPLPQPCRTDEPGVALCVDFEDQPLMNVAADRSPNKNDATAIAVGSTLRIAGEQAAVLSPMSSLRVPESPALDLTTFTIEMWIYPGALPVAKGTPDFGLFENHNQYTMRFQGDHLIRCGLSAALSADLPTTFNLATSREAVPPSKWSHVTCRYADGEMRVYVNGHLSGCKTMTALAPLGQLGLFGSAIGAELKLTPAKTAVELKDRFIGGVDNVRIYDRALDEASICAAAGQPAGLCSTSCEEEEELDNLVGPGDGLPSGH
jgi:hypothetical protein